MPRLGPNERLVDSRNTIFGDFGGIIITNVDVSKAPAGVSAEPINNSRVIRQRVINPDYAPIVLTTEESDGSGSTALSNSPETI